MNIELSGENAQFAFFKLAVQAHAMAQANTVILAKVLAQGNKIQQDRIIEEHAKLTETIIQQVAENLYAEYGELPVDIRSMFPKK